MKAISDMSIDEMRNEMQNYLNEFQDNESFVFASYSHLDRERVYPVVLQWMRDGYNVYIDLDFEIHGSDQNWVDQLKNILECGSCGLAVCFKSYHYAYSYAVLLELLTIRSSLTTDLQPDQKPIYVDVITLEKIPADKNSIPEKLKTKYEEIYLDMQKSMGRTFAGHNSIEKKVLQDGLKYWLEDWGNGLAGMDQNLKKELGYQNLDASTVMDHIQKCYQRGSEAFFPYIAFQIKSWFKSYNLTGNDIVNLEKRFEKVGIYQVSRPVSEGNLTENSKIINKMDQAGGMEQGCPDIMKYWQGFNNYAEKTNWVIQNPGVKIPNPGNHNWHAIRLGSSIFRIECSVNSQRDILRAGFFVKQRPDIFENLKLYREDIDAGLSDLGKIVWAEASHSANISVYSSMDKKNIEPQYQWFCTAVSRLLDVIYRYVQ